MTQSLPQLILPIKMEKSSERLTSLSGLVIWEELARASGIWDRLDAVLQAPQSGRGYQPSEFVQPLVWMLHAGGRRLEDLRELRAEEGALKEVGLRAGPGVGAGGAGEGVGIASRAGCRDGRRLAPAARTGRGGRGPGGQPGNGAGSFAAGARGSDLRCRRPRDRGGEGRRGPDVTQGQRLHAAAGLRERYLRGTPVPGRQ